LPDSRYAEDAHSRSGCDVKQPEERETMKRLLLGLTIAGLGLVGCTKSVERAERDVQRAHDQAVRNIERKQEELQDTKRDADDRVAQRERRLEDTARQETDKIRKEERELDKAWWLVGGTDQPPWRRVRGPSRPAHNTGA
jgi:hypothetical protein